ncbi:hypothetical protein BGZ60DRAFT_524018 [Tricladium varicosporioides]|nr:hypothetical protein BGZ60DRAFT_524018 [Hymenoscyphus varicosporioides]
MRSSIALTALFAATVLARGSLLINNNCAKQVFVRTSYKGGCDVGPHPGGVEQDKNFCYNTPWKIEGGKSQRFDFQEDGEGSSIKIGTNNQLNNGYFQFEYTVATMGTFWDLSDLDGAGPNKVGSPFRHDDLSLIVGGTGSGQGTCKSIKCPKEQICKESYQLPWDNNTRGCPRTGSTFELNLCATPKQMARAAPLQAVSFQA